MHMHTDRYTCTSHASQSQATQEREFMWHCINWSCNSRYCCLQSVSSTVNHWVHRAQLKPQKEFLWINPTSPLISYNFPPAHFPAVQLFCSHEHWSVCFGLAERWQRELGGSRVVSTEWEDLRTIISSVHGTSFCGLSRV